MNIEDQTYLEWAFKGLVGIAATAMLQAYNLMRTDVRALRTKVDVNFDTLDSRRRIGDDDLQQKRQALELRLSENYVVKTDLAQVRQETKESLDRIHKRIDEGNAATASNFKDTQKGIDDIRTILINDNRKQ